MKMKDRENKNEGGFLFLGASGFSSDDPDFVLGTAAFYLMEYI